MEFSNDLSMVEVYFLISLVCLVFFVVLYRNVGGRMLSPALFPASIPENVRVGAQPGTVRESWGI